MYDLINIFDVFLPQLLLYPNPADPLNGEAANLLIKDPEKYKERVREYVKKFASEDVFKEKKTKDGKHSIELKENDDNNEENDHHDPSQLSELSNASVDEDECSEVVSE